MASDNETVAEIVEEIRTIPWKVYNQEIEGDDDCGISQSYCNVLAERVEAAHRRDVAELRECLKEAVEWSCGNPDEACEDCAAHGGDTQCKCEKWRKALEGAD